MPQPQRMSNFVQVGQKAVAANLGAVPIQPVRTDVNSGRIDFACIGVKATGTSIGAIGICIVECDVGVAADLCKLKSRHRLPHL